MQSWVLHGHAAYSTARGERLLAAGTWSIPRCEQKQSRAAPTTQGKVIIILTILNTTLLFAVASVGANPLQPRRGRVSCSGFQLAA